ncbi:MAG: hypothetical protein L3K23_10730, partial [Thermoplasmata archaeon]|nr:hypothetical protein [Thermoplasmata archaeon]
DNVTSRFSRGQSATDATFVQPVGDPTRISALPNVLRIDVLDPKRVRLWLSGGPAEHAVTLRALVGLDLGLISFQESKSALEQIYLEQVARGD